MQKLKELMQRDVIDAIKDKEKYAEFGLTIPNGDAVVRPSKDAEKTFFAEKFAEEVGYKFFNIKPSDIQSKWVNANPGKHKKIYLMRPRKKCAKYNFIDELDALIPNRENPGVNHMNTSAVNEFLAQMN